eukprot:scaffold290332_cov22-Tisochrysis_lutea.AAC.5
MDDCGAPCVATWDATSPRPPCALLMCFQVASSEEAETLITQHLEGNPLSKSVADLNKKLETTLGKKCFQEKQALHL